MQLLHFRSDRYNNRTLCLGLTVVMPAAAAAAGIAAAAAQVVYPGLTNHRGHDVLSRMLNPGYGFGGLLGLDLGSPAKAEAVSVTNCLIYTMYI